MINIFLSILITGFSVYWALTSFQSPRVLRHLFLPNSSSSSPSSSEPVRVLLSFFSALGVGVAEVLIYALYLRQAREARFREKRLKERKEFVGEVGVRVGVDDSAKMKNISGPGVGDGNGNWEKDQEHIWGRGMNGGIRRRVREKWERKENERSS